MERAVDSARKLLQEWKGENYTFGFDVLGKAGDYAARYGKRALVMVADLGQAWMAGTSRTVLDSLRSKGVEAEVIVGAGPNAPREDVYRLALHVARSRPEVIVAVGGGSTIDAAKAANVLAAFSPEDVSRALGAGESTAGTVDPYFGVGLVTRVKEAAGKTLLPVIAVQTAASSGAHLTKYSNITDPVTGQKKLIVDEAIVPPASVFDYGVTLGAPMDLTLDGGLDGIAHAWEVFMGATGQPYYDKMKAVAEACLGLIVEGLPKVRKDPRDRDARLAAQLTTLHCRAGAREVGDVFQIPPHSQTISVGAVEYIARACGVDDVDFKGRPREGALAGPGT